MTDGTAKIIFNLESDASGDIAARQIEWDRRAFSEPTLIAGGAGHDPFVGDLTAPAAEALVYTDLQYRDSELGARLIEKRKSHLRESIELLRSAMTKRERDAAMARTLISTMEKINAAEPNPQLRYGERAFEEIEARITGDLREFSYLRTRRVFLDAVYFVLQSLEASSRPTRISDEIMRLFGQNYRSQARLRAFARNFPGSFKERLPSLENFKNDRGVNGYLLPLSDDRSPVVIDQRTAAFLRHWLETISRLAAVSAEYLRSRPAAADVAEETWFPLLSLVRAVVEFFYFCNFELPFCFTDLLVDTGDANMIWTLDREHGGWRSTAESIGATRHLKRVSSEAAHILIEDQLLLDCRSAEEVNRYLKRETPPEAGIGSSIAPQFYAYSSCGLADFDFNPSGQRVKFQTAFASIGVILDKLAAGQSECPFIAKSALGGPLETILGLAALNPRAFGIETAGDPNGPLNRLERFGLLSRFWRTTGRRRATSMLGEEYAKAVSSGMEALGELGPDHPTFTSVALKPAMASLAEQRGEKLADPFGSLVIADQIRLVEMLNITWTIVSDFLARLKDVHSQGKLKRILEGLPQSASEQQAELQKRFNSKWVHSTDWIWSLLRGSAPALWDFWIKIGEGSSWTEPFLSAPPLQGLGLILRLSSEIARIILLIEASGSAMGERLEVDAETAGHTVISGVQGYAEGGPLPAAISEPINYYFDPEVRFDSWLAFTSSFQNHLRQMEADLRAMKASKPHIKGLTSVITQLDMLYPSRAAADSTEEKSSIAAPEAVASIGVPAGTGVIKEADAELFSRVYFELLGMPEGETAVFLKLLSMLVRKDTEKFLQSADKIHSLIADLLPKQRHRVLLFTLPKATSAFFDSLLLLDQDQILEASALEQLKARTSVYFVQLESFAQALTSLTAQLPNMLPSDKEVLGDFLKATAPVNRDVSFLLFFASDQLMMDVSANRADRTFQIESATAKARAYLREKVEVQFDESLIEIFPIGGGRLICRDGQFFLAGHNESFEFAFSEPDQAMSNYLLSRVTSIKFSFVAQILRKEFPRLHFIAQL